MTSKEYLAEAKAMEKEASGKARSVNTLLVENKGRHVGIFFDDNEAVFDPYTAIIAALQSVRYKDTRNFCPCHWQPMTEDLFWNTSF